MVAAVVTSLAIAATPAAGPTWHWTLRCSPARGTLPHRVDACRKLLARRAPFAPPPAGEVCSAIYGGPEVARVTGTFRGRRVAVVFRRRNGCEIDRWDKLRFLFPIRLSGP